MGTSYDSARDMEYIRRRAEESGLDIKLIVSSWGFTIQALRGGRAAGSSCFQSLPVAAPLPDLCLQESVDRAIANAMGAL